MVCDTSHAFPGLPCEFVTADRCKDDRNAIEYSVAVFHGKPKCRWTRCDDKIQLRTRKPKTEGLRFAVQIGFLFYVVRSFEVGFIECDIPTDMRSHSGLKQFQEFGALTVIAEQQQYTLLVPVLRHQGT